MNKKLEQFIAGFPLLLPTLDKLSENSIDYAIGGSGCLFLLGNDRRPDDVDIYLRNEDHDHADELFGITSYFYESTTEHVRNSNPEHDHSIQLTSHLEITVDAKKYDLSLNDDVIKNCIKVEYGDRTFVLYPPEDVLLIKAILQRGTDVGKKDIEDIQNFMKIYPINKEYLEKRIHQLSANSRVANVFKN